MNKTIINPVLKDEVTFTQSAAHTNGRITSLHVKLMPGGGTPMHYHNNFDETFIVLEGELSVALQDKTICLQAGEEYTVRRKASHHFFNQSSSPVVFTTIIRPGCIGFENALRILYGLARDKRTDDKGRPSSMIELAVISHMSDMHLPGAAMLLSPLFMLLGFIGRIKGVEKRLIETYCNQ